MEVSELFAKRLKAARLQKGLSQDALAGELGVSKQAVSKYERAKMLPDSSVLIKLAKLLELKPDYFFREFRVSLDQVKFRKKAALSGRKLEGLKNSIVDMLERYLELEEHLNASPRFNNPISKIKIQEIADVEEAALKLLKHWKLGINPIPNVIEMLEDSGIKVVEVSVENKFDGLSAWVNKNIPVIVLNKDFDQLRKRFTALHELGHLLLNISPELSEKEIEKTCNRFAGAMLLPRPAALQELGSSRKHISLNELIPIKESYGISIQAIMYRAGDLGILNSHALRSFWKLVNSHPDNKLEKNWGEYRGYERSKRFDQLLYHAVAEELISYGKAASLSNMSVQSFRDQLKMIV
ncbi:MAG: ImmA/IrrE family metallo-endopeptidase [Bacteroidetes bacterium]|nr:ImmA/IrrE family metallo-endopeptidase [Bacteroidota bacterium]